MPEITKRLARSRLAPWAAFPMRARAALAHSWRVNRAACAWLIRSREHTNFTYRLSARNLEHLAWWVSDLSGVPLDRSRGYLAELEADSALRSHLLRATAASPRSRLADKEVRYARRAGWYALVRATRPTLVVETGTDKGLGSCVLAAALLANGHGRLVTIDVNDDSGYLIGGPYGTVCTRVVDDSVHALNHLLEPIDMFLHDSLHTFEHESAELQAVGPKLAPGSLVLSDNAHATDALMHWTERQGWRFTFFQEQPEGHWYPGGGIGAAQRTRPL